jgi:hypothetical protein
MAPDRSGAAVMNEFKRATAVKAIRITVETETLMIVRRARAVLAWCPDCRSEVQVIRLDNNDLGEPVTATQLHELLGTGKTHFWQPATGPAQICVTSLLQSFESAEDQRAHPPDQIRRKRQ